MKEITLQEMLSTIIGELRENGRWGTAHIYQSTLNVFSAFNNYRDLHLRKLNPVVLKCTCVNEIAVGTPFLPI